jgi:hypothetical protein
VNCLPSSKVFIWSNSPNELHLMLKHTFMNKVICSVGVKYVKFITVEN